MAISMALGGFSAAEADELRRAMGNHRKLPKLKAVLNELARRMVERGLEPEKARSITEDLISFANYGFPESHAWSFALIAYATAYLKANHPAEFFMAMLNAWPMGFYSPATLVHQARRDGVTVLGPCMRDGEWDCTLVPVPASSGSRGESPAGQGSSHPAADGSRCGDGAGDGAGAGPAAISRAGGSGDPAGAQRRGGSATGARIAQGPAPAPSPAANPEDASPAIRVGWRHIRGLGERVRENLQRARADRPFTSLEDVVRRAELTRADALHLARAGAFEAFQPGRRRAAWDALRAAGDTLPLAPARHLPFDPDELEGEELIFLDYLATGISPDGHPMEHLRARLDAEGILGAGRLAELRDGQSCTVAGLVVARQHPSTAKGTVFLLLEDEAGFINVIVPARLYRRTREIVNHAAFLVVEGRFEREDTVQNVVGFRFRELPARALTYRSKDFS